MIPTVADGAAAIRPPLAAAAIASDSESQCCPAAVTGKVPPAPAPAGPAIAGDGLVAVSLARRPPAGCGTVTVTAVLGLPWKPECLAPALRLAAALRLPARAICKLVQYNHVKCTVAIL